MTTQPDHDGLPSPIELLDSARQKYILAQARVRRGPPELAMLSLHGSLEDALRAHAIRRRLPAAALPFPQLLEALAADAEAALSAGEADGIMRMHRLRARVAHGEQITVTAETIDAYQRLAARLLARYGVLVVAPAEVPGPEAPRSAATTVRLERPAPERGSSRPRGLPPEDRAEEPRRRPRDPEGAPRRGERRGGSTYPLLDRYPDLAGRRDPPSSAQQAVERAERTAAFLGRSQGWLLPLIILGAIFLIGLTISLALQQPTGPAALPTAAAQAPSFVPEITTAPAVGDAAVNSVPGSPAPTAEPTAIERASPLVTAPPAGALAAGLLAYVRPTIEGLNLRDAPGTNQATVLSLAPGTQVEVIEGPVTAEGREWWRVRSAGVEGWCAGEFLELR